MTEKTYWNGKGRYSPLGDKLNALVPVSGPCESARGKNKFLERYRRACNAYYDLFNNGGMNRAREIRAIFDLPMYEIRCTIQSSYGRQTRINFGRAHEKMEPRMDEIVLAAAAEQGLLNRVFLPKQAA